MSTDEGLHYIPEEETLSPEETNKLFCFLNPDRVCGPDCMAYITFPRDHKASELAEVQRHCSLLLSFERVGVNVTILASAVVSETKRKKISELDAKRDASATGTSPFPNPFPAGRTK